MQCINCACATRYAGPTAWQHNHPPAHPAAVAVGQAFALLSGLPARSPKHHILLISLFLSPEVWPDKSACGLVAKPV